MTDCDQINKESLRHQESSFGNQALIEPLENQMNNPHKDTGSSTHQENNPQKNTGSPIDQGNNPQKNTGSPIDQGNNPQTNTGSPIDQGNNPQKNTRSPIDQENNPQKNTGSPIDQENNPQKNTGSPTDQGNNPQKNAESPIDQENNLQKNTVSPIDKEKNPQKNTGSPIDQENNPQKDTGSPIDQENNPQKDTGSPIDQDNNPQKDTGSPIDQDINPQKNTGSPLDKAFIVKTVDEKIKKVIKNWIMTTTTIAAVTASLGFLFGCYYTHHKTPTEVIEFAINFSTFCSKENLTYEECIKQFKSMGDMENNKITTETLNSTVYNLTYMQSTTINNLINKTESLKNRTEKMRKELDTCKKTNEYYNKTLDQLNNKLSNIDVKAEINKVEIDYSDYSKTDKGVFLLVTFMLATGEFIIVVVLCWIKNALKKKTLGRNNDRQINNGNIPRERGFPSVLDGINRRTDIKNCLCILSFHPSTQEKHCKMVNSFVDGSIQKKSFLVTEHDDVKHLPSCKLFIAFVDFNERNIILESEREMGDLKKTTVKAVWKIGAEVILVYCGDKYAEPTGDSLYNKRLTSIREHPELSKLEATKRVLTVNNNKFTESQRIHLQDLTANLKTAN